jgi:hypothetical protein
MLVEAFNTLLLTFTLLSKNINGGIYICDVCRRLFSINKRLEIGKSPSVFYPHINISAA